MCLSAKWADLDRLYRAHAEAIATLPHSGALDRPVFGAGAEDAVLMLIGEAPGAQETEQGKPFVGKAGQQLDAFLQAIGLERAALFVTNAVKYRPIKPGSRANRTPTGREIAFGRDLLRAEIAVVQPKLVATLGNVPLFALTEDRSLRIGDCHGRILEGGRGDCPIFPLYHPASLIYNPTLRPAYESDLAKLAQRLSLIS